MLAFVAPDKDQMVALKQEVRWYLAWRWIREESEALNLDAAQNRETENRLLRSDETVDARLKEAYCWLLVPYIDRNQDLRTIHLDPIRISGGTETIVQKAAQQMLQNELVIERWAPVLLRMELDNLLWRDSDHISIKTLWEYFCMYCYLPRLANFTVLEEAIRMGLNSSEYFAYAAGFDGSRYIDLKFNQPVDVIAQSGYLVKVEKAALQIAKEAAKRGQESRQVGTDIVHPSHPEAVGVSGECPGVDVSPGDIIGDGTEPPAPSPRVTEFYLSTKLDTMRIVRDVNELMEEVVKHLLNTNGCQVEISLEVRANSPDGFPEQVVRVVSENSRTLKVNDFGFYG